MNNTRLSPEEIEASAESAITQLRGLGELAAASKINPVALRAAAEVEERRLMQPATVAQVEALAEDIQKLTRVVLQMQQNLLPHAPVLAAIRRTA